MRTHLATYFSAFCIALCAGTGSVQAQGQFNDGPLNLQVRLLAVWSGSTNDEAASGAQEYYFRIKVADNADLDGTTLAATPFTTIDPAFPGGTLDDDDDFFFFGTPITLLNQNYPAATPAGFDYSLEAWEDDGGGGTYNGPTDGINVGFGNEDDDFSTGTGTINIKGGVEGIPPAGRNQVFVLTDQNTAGRDNKFGFLLEYQWTYSGAPVYEPPLCIANTYQDGPLNLQVWVEGLFSDVTGDCIEISTSLDADMVVEYSIQDNLGGPTATGAVGTPQGDPQFNFNPVAAFAQGYGTFPAQAASAFTVSLNVWEDDANCVDNDIAACGTGLTYEATCPPAPFPLNLLPSNPDDDFSSRTLTVNFRDAAPNRDHRLDIPVETGRNDGSNYIVRLRYRWTLANPSASLTNAPLGPVWCNDPVQLNLANLQNTTFIQWQENLTSSCGAATGWTDLPGENCPSLTVPTGFEGTRAYRALLMNRNSLSPGENGARLDTTVVCTEIERLGPTNPGPAATIQGACGGDVIEGLTYQYFVDSFGTAPLTYTWTLNPGTDAVFVGPSNTRVVSVRYGALPATLSLVVNSPCGPLPVATCTANPINANTCDIIYVTPAGGGTGLEDSPTDLLTALGIANGAGSDQRYIRLARGSYNLPAGSFLSLTNDSIILEGGWVFTPPNNWVHTSDLTPGTKTILNIDAPQQTATIGPATFAYHAGVQIANQNDWVVKDIDFNINNGVGGTTQPVGQFPAGERGISVYGFLLNNCQGYQISNCRINTGNGTAGGNGVNGVDGNDATIDGAIGGNYSGNTGGAGGAGGLGASGGPGPDGGNGANGATGANEDSQGNDGPAGSPGGGANGGTAGGGGARGTDIANCCVTQDSDGQPGGDGGDGGDGADFGGGPAQAPTNASFVNALWIPNGQAANGGDGGGGGGGGGGGSGASQNLVVVTSLCGGPGCSENGSNGAAGGGGGGEGATGGTGGWGGGASFSVYCFDGSGQLINSNVGTGAAGAGGAGGIGGTGGNGSNGGPYNCNDAGCNSPTNPGNRSVDAQCGAGGPGGAGGDGGDGGDGQQGANGLAQALVTAGTSTTAAVINPTLNGPADPNLAVTYKLGCSNSAIPVELLAGPAGDFTDLFNAELVPDVAAGTSSFTLTDDSIEVYYDLGEGGVQSFAVNGAVYPGFVLIFDDTRPLPQFDPALPDSICDGDQINLGTDVSTGLEYDWQIAQLATPTAPVFSFAVEDPGLVTLVNTTGLPQPYLIRVRVRDECCGWSIYNYDTVVVMPLPYPGGPITGPAEACPSDVVQFNTDPVPVVEFYEWLPDWTASVNTLDTFVTLTVPAAPGTYTLRMVPNSFCGTGDTSVFQFDVIDAPLTPTGIVGPQVFCDDANLNASYFVSPVAGATNYNWSVTQPGDGSVLGTSGPNNDTASVRWLTTGSDPYTLQVTAQNACGVSPPFSLEVTRINFTPPTLAGVVSTPTCDNQNVLVNLTNTASGVFYLLRNLPLNLVVATDTGTGVPADIVSLEIDTLYFFNPPPATYDFYLQAQDSATGCIDTLLTFPLASVNVLPIPDSTVVPSPLSVNACPGDPATFTIAAPEAGVTYTLFDTVALTTVGTGSNGTLPFGFLGGIAITDTGTYRILADNGTCSALLNARVSISSVDTPAYVTTDTNHCAGAAFGRTFAGLPVGYTYEVRDFATGVTTYPITAGAFTIPDADIAAPNTAFVLFATSTSGGCVFPVDTFTISPVTAPANPTIATDADICTATDATGTLTGTVAGFTYEIRDGLGAVVATGTPFTIPAANLAAGANTFDVVAVSASVAGCEFNVGTVNVNVIAGPGAVTVTTAADICTGTDATGTFTGTAAGFTYEIRDGLGAVVATGTPFTIPAATLAAGANSFTVFAVNTLAAGCEFNVGTVNVNVVDNPGPVAVTTAADICTGTDATGTFTGTAADFTYEIRDGLGAVVATGTPFTIPAATLAAGANSFTVFAVSTLAAGCEFNVGTVNVNVVDNPGPVTVTNATDLCEGNDLAGATLTGTVAGFTYEIRDGLGAVVATGTPFTIPAANLAAGANTFDVVAVSASVAGCEFNVGTVNVNVIAGPGAVTVTTAADICTGDAVLGATLGSTVAGFDYEIRDALGTTLATNSPFDLLSASLPVGLNSFSVVASSTAVPGCEFPVGTFDVNVVGAPAAIGSGSPYNVCEGSDLSDVLTGLAADFTYELRGASTIVVGAGGAFTVPAADLAPGNNTFDVFATSALAAGCEFNVGTITATVQPLANPTVGVNIAPVCADAPAIVIEILAPEAGYTYEAFEGGASVGTGTASITVPIGSVLGGDIDLINAYPTGDNTCAIPLAGAPFPVTINPLPGAVANVVAQSCPGDDFDLVFTGDAATYELQDPAGILIGSTSTVPFSIRVPGSYAAATGPLGTLVGTSSAGCVRVDSVAVTVLPAPTAAFTSTPTNTEDIFVEDAIAFLDLSTGGVNSWGWDFGDGSVAAEQNPTYVYPDTGTYPVQLTVTSADGCTDDTTLTYVILQSDFVIIPTVFTPNGDGQNDVFRLSGPGNNRICLSVFNRWGKAIRTGICGTQPEWNGQEEGGADVPEGVYVYVMEFVRSDGETATRTGTVMLLR